MRPRTTVTLLQPQISESWDSGVPAPDWDQPPVEHPDTPAAIEPLSSAEQVLTADTVISRWRLFLEPGTGITAQWRVRWLGIDHEVDGEIEVWQGRRPRVECTLKRITR